MKYGDLPKELGRFEINCKEMLFYQYLPIKLIGDTTITNEKRLSCFNDIIGVICCDYIGVYGLDNFVNSYVYITAKKLYQKEGCSFNRKGYHSDGFLTNDINYIWSDCKPTVFNNSNFNLTLDDKISLKEMEEQADELNIETYPDNTLLRLNQFNIHRVSNIQTPCFRTFLKVSISKDKYDLLGNSHNYLLDYNWEMKQRSDERNIPQSNILNL